MLFSCWSVLFPVQAKSLVILLSCFGGGLGEDFEKSLDKLRWSRCQSRDGFFSRSVIESLQVFPLRGDVYS